MVDNTKFKTNLIVQSVYYEVEVLRQKNRVCTETKKEMFASSANRDQKRHFQGPNFAPIV